VAEVLNQVSWLHLQPITLSLLVRVVQAALKVEMEILARVVAIVFLILSHQQAVAAELVQEKLEVQVDQAVVAVPMMAVFQEQAVAEQLIKDLLVHQVLELVLVATLIQAQAVVLARQEILTGLAKVEMESLAQ
jgi:membrane-anchored protein YejM (alkaline phosphatase superfamily)